MKAALIRISGHWAHFRRPETNNNPLTHDMITKTALIGLMGAVNGIEREEMKLLFPQLSDDIIYGVKLESRVWKQSWGFTLRRFDTDKAGLVVTQVAPKYFEFLREPQFTISVALASPRSEEYFDEFILRLREERSAYEPVLGLHNCPATLKLIGTYDAERHSGPFETSGFVPTALRPKPAPKVPGRIGFDSLPTIQDDNWLNPRDKYVSVVYLDPVSREVKATLSATGEYVRIGGAAEEVTEWAMI